MTALRRQSELKKSIRSGAPVLGLFIKFPAIQVIESLAVAGLDFVVLDAEHAAFSSKDLDHCILAGRSVDLPVLVRLRESTPTAILQALDMGAAGIIVPHILSAGQAETVLAATRYKDGTRGFSGVHRAAAYGAIPSDDFKSMSDESIIVIAQIEDTPGLKNITEISAVSGIDALLIGPADLAVSLGADKHDEPTVVQAIDAIFDAARNGGMRGGIFLPTAEHVASYRDKGASFFIIATDQGLLVDAARNVAHEFNFVSGRTNGK